MSGPVDALALGREPPDVEPPDAEALRLRALQDLHILDTPPDERFDRITRLAARLLRLPIAQINLLDGSRQWTKSGYGADAVEVPRTVSFCSHTIGRHGIYEVPDALVEPLFAGNPLVSGAPGVRFYAGRALRTGDGHAVGTLCVIGREPRELTDEERSLIDALGAWVEAELRRLEVRDLLARREANEQLLRGILHSMLDAVLLVTPDGRVQASNLAAERLFGYDEVGLERPLTDLVSDLRPADLHATDGSEEAEGPQHAGPMERMALTASGHLVPVELTVTLLRDQSGERHVVSVRDLRPRQESQDELHRLQRLNGLILDSTSEAIFSIDRDSRITSANRAATRMLGYGCDELIGARIHELFHHTRPDGSPYPAEECPFSQAFSTGQSVRVTGETIWRRDGTPLPVEMSFAPIRDEHSIIGAVQTFVDMSEQEAANKIKDEFLSLVSHELRTPLTSIRGSLGLLAGGVFGRLDAEPARMVDIAIHNTDRLVRLVNEILDLERMKTGQFVLELRPTDLGALMSSAVEGLHGVAAMAQVELAVEALSLQVVLDPDRIAQALTNLLGNAVKFSRSGGRVTLDAMTAGDKVVLRVRDKGRGIPPEQLDRVFSPFEQVDVSDARDKGGTGLGLPIARSIAEHHGGRLWAESALGAGSTFYLELPTAVPPEDPPTRRPTAVLLWEDADASPGVLPALSERGYAAVPVSTDAEVRAALERTSPAAIVVALGRGDRVEPAVLATAGAAADAAGIPLVAVGAPTAGAGSVDPLSQALEQGGLQPWSSPRAGESRRVLIVEDDPDLATVLTAQLRGEGLRTWTAATEQEAIDLAVDVRPDVIVLDLLLSEGDGFGVVRALREQGRLSDTSLVVYSVLEPSPEEQDRLRTRQTVFLVKSRATIADVADRITSLLGSATTSPGDDK